MSDLQILRALSHSERFTLKWIREDAGSLNEVRDSIDKLVELRLARITRIKGEDFDRLGVRLTAQGQEIADMVGGDA